MLNLRDETGEDGYGVVGEPIDMDCRMEDIPDHLLAERLPLWGRGQWVLCAITCLVVVGLGCILLTLLGILSWMPVASGR